MEWKRVIGKKRFLPGILLICLVGLFFFLQAIVLDFRGEKDSFGTGFAEAAQARKDVLEELRKLVVSCRNGRQRLALQRLGLFALFAVVTGVLFYGVMFACAWWAYGVPDLGAPVQSLDFLREFKGHCSIVQYLIWQNVSRFLILGAVSSVTVAISTAVKKTELAMGIAGVVLLLPSLLDRLGIHQFEKLAVGSLFTVSYPGVSMILLVCVLSAAVIVAGCMYTTWKWEK